MKNLIVFATKYGTTEKCAEMLSKSLSGETTLYNLGKGGKFDISGYDNIIIGGSIKAGQLDGRVKKYITQNKDAILTKKFGIFLCCIDDKTLDEYFSSNLPADILEKALVKSSFGGEVIFSKYGIFVKFLMSKIQGSTEDVHKINEANIKAFAEKF